VKVTHGSVQETQGHSLLGLSIRCRIRIITD
jgi:hypothetical protein